MVSKRCKRNGVNFMNLQSSNGDIIPEWLLIEVLIRLSTKVVHRFKIVSKQWLSVISDPSFVRYYVSRASSLLQPWTFISCHMHHESCNCLRFSECELLKDIYSQVTKPSYFVLPLPCTQSSSVGETFVVCGVSNGLVLYSSHDQSLQVLSYYICNLVTSQWIALPKFKWFFAESCGFLIHVEDGLLKSYRVVRLELPGRGMKSLRIDVFFSEIGKWKKFTISINIKEWKCFRGVATAVNGVMYWIVDGLGIIAYDPDQSPTKVHTIAFPHDIHDSTYDSKCGAYEGKLRYFKVCGSRNQDTSFKVWVLNDHVSGDWSLQHKISDTDIECDANLSFKILSSTPLSFHPFDLDVVYFGWEDAMVSLNIETKRLEVVQGKCYRQKPGWQWVSLLVIPSWPTSLPCFKV